MNVLNHSKSVDMDIDDSTIQMFTYGMSRDKIVNLPSLDS